MYRPSELKTGLSKLWGWDQNYDPSEFTISDSLTETDTGQYYQELHPLLTLENIKAIAPDFNRINYPDWVVDMQYRIGDRVIVSNHGYRAKVANIGLTPETNPDEWERFDPFSEWLEKKTQGSILKAIRSFWDAKLSKREMKNLLENKALFNGAGRITDLVPVGTSLVGFELVPLQAQGVTTKIEKIGLQMTGQTVVKLYVFHSSQKYPIREISLNRVNSSGMQWFSIQDLYLPYVSSLNDAGGSWYLVYDQGALGEGIQAINKTKDWSKAPCSSCDYEEVANYDVWSQYLKVYPFKTTPELEGENPVMWDLDTNVYTSTNNYGINLQISIQCDITDLILDNKTAFQNIVGLQVATDLIREMAFNPQFNITRTTQNFSRQAILLELDGELSSNKKSGLMLDYQNAIKAVEIDVESLGEPCFSCAEKPRGIRFKVI